MTVWDINDTVEITGKVEFVVADEKGNIYAEKTYDDISKSERWLGKRELMEMHQIEDRIVFVVKN